MTMDQLTTANAVPLPDQLSDDQQARAAAVHQARIALASRGFGSNSLSTSTLDLLDVATFILDGTVTTTLESLDVDYVKHGQVNGLADHLEAHGVTVGVPYRDRLADAVVVDLGDLRTVVDYLGAQGVRDDEPPAFPSAYGRLSAAVQS